MILGFLIVPIALVAWAMYSQRHGQQPSAQDETPLEILRRRYARGEISQEEFEQARRAIL